MCNIDHIIWHACYAKWQFNWGFHAIGMWIFQVEICRQWKIVRASSCYRFVHLIQLRTLFKRCKQIFIDFFIKSYASIALIICYLPKFQIIDSHISAHCYCGITYIEDEEEKKNDLCLMMNTFEINHQRLPCWQFMATGSRIRGVYRTAHRCLIVRINTAINTKLFPSINWICL